MTIHQAIIVELPRAEAPREAQTVGLLRLWLRRIRERREMRELALRQPDSVLRDAGVDREEALRRSRRPFWSP